ncbi:G2/mitotic-specific cyclin [Tulasnella sp. 424]|nr:G2/mitotic-specific cyclin [Tulasnella sp. 424]
MSLTEGRRNDHGDSSQDRISSSEYAEDIYQYLQDLEAARMPRHRFMDELPEQAWLARGIVVDQLLSLLHELGLLSETFWMTVNLFDRLLSVRTVRVARFPFTGLVCASLAAKSQEGTPRQVNWWKYSSNDEDTAEMFLSGELALCQSLGWHLECPNPLAFLRRISIADGSDVLSFRLAKYLVLMQCFDPQLLEYPPSVIAASAYWLTRISLKKLISKQPEGLVHCTSYGTDKLLPAATSMNDGLGVLLRLGKIPLGGSRLNAGLEAELPFLKEATDDSWRESYPFEEWIEEEEKIGSEATCDSIPAQAVAPQDAPNSE